MSEQRKRKRFAVKSNGEIAKPAASANPNGILYMDQKYVTTTTRREDAELKKLFNDPDIHWATMKGE